jgi:hypothetical protein
MDHWRILLLGGRPKSPSDRLAPNAAEYCTVLRESMVLFGTGAAAGLAVTIVVLKPAAGLLFGVNPDDPTSLAAAIGLLAAVTLVASAVPAMRAARMDPTTALRYEQGGCRCSCGPITTTLVVKDVVMAVIQRCHIASNPRSGTSVGSRTSIARKSRSDIREQPREDYLLSPPPEMIRPPNTLSLGRTRNSVLAIWPDAKQRCLVMANPV